MKIPSGNCSVNIISFHCSSTAPLFAISCSLKPMRFPSCPTIVRTFYTLTNTTSRPFTAASQKTLTPFTRGTTILRSMPTLPFLGSLFSSSSSSKEMTYPVTKSDNEWQAVLNKGSQVTIHIIRNVDLTSYLRTIPHPPRKGHRSSLHRCLRQAHAQQRRLHMRRLRRPSLHRNAQVQVRLRLACLLRFNTRCRYQAHGPHVWHGQNRDSMQ